MVVLPYTAVIVLAPGIEEAADGRFEYSAGGLAIKYTVDSTDQHLFRFQAARALAEQGRCARFLLVGGPVQRRTADGLVYLDGSDQRVRVSKPEVMGHFLKRVSGLGDMVGKRRIDLVTIESQPSTMGNAQAVAEYFRREPPTTPGAIGLLTNFYHLPRAMRFFGSACPYSLVPICAESLVLAAAQAGPRGRPSELEAQILATTSANLLREIRGLGALEQGTYQAAPTPMPPS